MGSRLGLGFRVGVRCLGLELGLERRLSPCRLGLRALGGGAAGVPSAAARLPTQKRGVAKRPKKPALRPASVGRRRGW